MGESTVFSILFITIGIFTIIASLSNWNYFFNHRKAQIFIRLFGRTGARIFYIIPGPGISAIGFLAIPGVINLNN